ncbi:hypothetical protein SY27_13985 [Flavobacterium sp. 316]|uniref:Uncharacterized protein n=1 Tax=Flavobacterium sediminilitoris TaxID=2024526 RepID=A0ABY4HMH2_9FLAO|nr:MULTISPECIES: hypothetical protein [Flavobacterium]KIX20244.1 hypothetical protein SY27_13985 [Flavobacterium sp. 316]UOX33427.1 hypothetical protein LXD69_15485 [Flavobacterium sediminilitoris]
MKKENTNKNIVHGIVHAIQIIGMVTSIVGLSNLNVNSKPPKNAFLDDIHKHMAKVKLDEMKVKNEKNKNAIAFDSIFIAMKNKK